MSARPIRVLHFVASSSGGGATYARDLAEGLDPAEFRNTLLMPADRGQMSPAELQNTRVWDGGVLQIRALAGDHDVLNCHGARAAFFARLACSHLGARRPAVVYTIHGFMVPRYPLPKRLVYGSIEHLLKGQSDRCIAVSHAEKQAWCQYGLAPEAAVDVVPYGMAPRDRDRSQDASRAEPATLRKSLDLPEDAVVMIQVARFYWPRDFETLLRAFDEAAGAHPRLHLVLVGDGPWRPDVEHRIAALTHGSRVTLTGIRRDVEDLFCASDIAVLSSAGGDGFPIVNLEAMRCSLPVISADCDGIPEQIIPHENGYLYPVGRADIFAQHMLTLANDQPLRRRMGQAGADLVANTFTRDHLLQATAEAYRRSLGR